MSIRTIGIIDMQKWTIIIGRKTFIVSKWQICTLLLPFIFIFGLSLWSYGTAIHSVIIKINNSFLSHQRDTYMEKIVEIDRMTQSLERKHSRIVFRDEILRTVLSISSKEEVRMLGTGGRYLHNDVTCVLNNKVIMLDKKLERMEREQRLEAESLSDLELNLARSRKQLEHTPSIMPTWGRITSGFGWRRDPFTGRRSFHNGIDIANKKGTPVVATASGEVIYVGRMGHLGTCVKIKHGYGYISLFGHLETAAVKTGDNVERGNIIGYLGNSGRSTGPHLHYTIMKYGRDVNPLNYILLGNVIY
ncbi:MAG: M23 family metallopeptidase [candidate division WOR-3 bacterium]|nr:M23 family metallopeptidase [candidate division WOR-3 bacterium]